MYRLVNPFWKSNSEKKAAQHAKAVNDFLQANPTNRFVNLAELKAGLPLIEGDLTREVVNIICGIIDVKIDGADSL